MSPTVHVMVSSSNNIYRNLAWETWLYKNFDFSSTSLLLLYRNDPCVVIGRYQNPWKEVNMKFLDSSEILLARRHSGGGTVYHDLGNINFSFMTARPLYDRKKNLQFIVDVLRKRFGLSTAEVSPRDDIVVEGGLKVSGTAAKLGRRAAYHHCTLLCNVRKDRLREALKPNKVGIVTNATSSVPSPTVNLTELDPSLTSDRLLPLFAQDFLTLDTSQIVNIDADEASYPGLTSELSELQSTDFIRHKTPKFDVIREFNLPLAPLPHSSSLSLKLHVENGRFSGFLLDGNLPKKVLVLADSILSGLIGLSFDSREMWCYFQARSNDAVTCDNDDLKMAVSFMRHCILHTLSLQE